MSKHPLNSQIQDQDQQHHDAPSSHKQGSNNTAQTRGIHCKIDSAYTVIFVCAHPAIFVGAHTAILASAHTAILAGPYVAIFVLDFPQY
jgi:Flp pilus assembly protein TadB